jgi:hypothetical protein
VPSVSCPSIPSDFAGRANAQATLPTLSVSEAFRVDPNQEGSLVVASDLTAQGFAAIGYNWTRTISTAIGYRVLYTDDDRSGFVYDTTQQGPFASLGVHF